MSGIDKSSLATHIKCGSDLSKVYPGVNITEGMIKEAENLYNLPQEVSTSTKPFLIKMLNKIGWHGDETVE